MLMACLQAWGQWLMQKRIFIAQGKLQEAEIRFIAMCILWLDLCQFWLLGWSLFASKSSFSEIAEIKKVKDAPALSWIYVFLFRLRFFPAGRNSGRSSFLTGSPRMRLALLDCHFKNLTRNDSARFLPRPAIALLLCLLVCGRSGPPLALVMSVKVAESSSSQPKLLLRDLSCSLFWNRLLLGKSLL